MQNVRAGFTLVELLIVIAVITILASIVTVSYTKVQATARDSQVRDGAAKIAEAIETWSVQTNLNPKSAMTGSGSNATCTSTSAGGNGWLSAVYPCQLETVLEAGGYLPTGYALSVPYNTKYKAAGYNYMIYPCSSTGDWVLLYSLEAPTSTDSSNFSTIGSKCGTSSLQASYNMQGARLLNFTK